MALTQSVRFQMKADGRETTWARNRLVEMLPAEPAPSGLYDDLQHHALAESERHTAWATRKSPIRTPYTLVVVRIVDVKLSHLVKPAGPTLFRWISRMALAESAIGAKRDPGQEGVSRHCVSSIVPVHGADHMALVRVSTACVGSLAKRNAAVRAWDPAVCLYGYQGCGDTRQLAKTLVSEIYPTDKIAASTQISCLPRPSMPGWVQSMAEELEDRCSG
jgi:hypothetical protein